MKIGEVVKKYKVSKDTIHYYINYGLLVPPKRGSQYDFDEKTLNDLDSILDLKDLSFSLNEIHSILSLNRISGMKNKSDMDQLINIYTDKKTECEGVMEDYKRKISNLNTKIVNLRFENSELTQSGGVPLSMFGHLSCPICGKDFNVINATIKCNSLYAGDLVCDCGYSAIIEDGIIITPNRAKSLYDKPDLERELYKDLPPGMITLFQRSYNKMVDYLNRYSREESVVLETYVNAYFFMHNHIENLNPACKYIVIDKYPETLKMYRDLMNESGSKLDILFIADDSTNYPLKKNLVDLNIDFFAVNEHQFYNHSFLLGKLKPYMSNTGTFIGTYFYFNRGIKSIKNLISLYPESDPLNFNREYFFNEINKTHLDLADWQEMGLTTDSGENLGFGFHEKGEELHLMTYAGTIKGK